jgi:hypothetical protein
MIFAKNQEVYFLALKCKTTPGSSEIDRNLHKIQKIPPKVAATK